MRAESSLRQVASAAGMRSGSQPAALVARVRHLVAEEAALDGVRGRLELDDLTDREEVLRCLDRVVDAARWAIERGYRP